MKDCKKCICSECIETGDGNYYYFCHEANTACSNIKTEKCECFEEVDR